MWQGLGESFWSWVKKSLRVLLKLNKKPNHSTKKEIFANNHKSNLGSGSSLFKPWDSCHLTNTLIIALRSWAGGQLSHGKCETMCISCFKPLMFGIICYSAIDNQFAIGNCNMSLWPWHYLLTPPHIFSSLPFFTIKYVCIFHIFTYICQCLSPPLKCVFYEGWYFGLENCLK